MVTGWTRRSTLSTAITRAKTARRTAPLNPPSAFTLPVPNEKRVSWAWRLAYAYAKAVIARATVCEAMCRPSARSAIDP